MTEERMKRIGELARKAKSEGLDVTCETAPHYLILNDMNLKEDGRFKRFQENHYQRGYRVETICALLEKAGMEIVEILDADTREAVDLESERIYVVARECMKNA